MPPWAACARSPLHIALRQVLNRRLVSLSRGDLEARLAPFDRCLVDVGTGDGRFVYRYAAEHPETFCLGIDPVAEAMREVSAKAAKKPARGGLPNALYLMDAAETLPGDLAGVADLVTVNYPWGSLLRAWAAPEPVLLESLAALGKPDAEWLVLLNATVFEDADYCARLGFPPVDRERIEHRLAQLYAAAGFEVTEITEPSGPADHRTSWGQRLTLGSARKTLRIAGRIERPVER